MKSLNVLFLWHMHQPIYRAADTESFRLPWVRLHATKDYLGMIELVSRSPAFRMTFNFTPVLWDQMDAYASGCNDLELDIMLKPANSLSLTERRFILSRMFTGNPVSLINPYPRYAELFDRYGRGGEEAAHRMTERDINDICVWRVLSWIYPPARESHPFLASLINKSTGFDEQDKISLIEEVRYIIRQIPSKYRIFEELGQINISTSPYYHPILPILLNSDIAKESTGYKGVFPDRFQLKDDADWQVGAAIRRHTELFGDAPAGMWPSEGAVSKESCALFASHGIKWIATDEAILERTLERSVLRDSTGFVRRQDMLYQPYFVDTPEGEIAVFFRDHFLSDLIGFDYQSVSQDQAVIDFITRLKHIRDNAQSQSVDPCVAVILDGENAWEHYSDGGFPFLENLFHAIVNEQGLHLETMTTYLNALRRNKRVLKRLSDIRPGSWINGDFSIWIGQEEENRAWTYVSDLESALQQQSKPSSDVLNPDVARRFLLKAEGSDTFWWFGDDHYTAEKQDFDRLFRDLLIHGYESAGMIPPRYLFSPISSVVNQSENIDFPKNLISPCIDGDIKSYFDWFGAGSVSFRSQYSAMHSVSEKPVFQELKFGFDLKHLFLRMDPGSGFADFGQDTRVDVVFNNSSIESDLSIKLGRRTDGRVEVISISSLSGSMISNEIVAVFDRVLEIALPFSFLHLSGDCKVSFHIEIWRGERMVGRIPDRMNIEFFTPTEDYNSILWRV